MATLDQVFQREKAWIAACEDAEALIDKIGDWRDSAREAELNGQMLLRMRAGDLIELAQRRVVGLQALEMRAERAARPKLEPEPAAATSIPRESAKAACDVAPARGVPPTVTQKKVPPTPASPPNVDAGHARRAAEAEAARAATEKAKADARVATAEAERIELQNALLKRQLEAARRAPAPTTMVKRPTKPGASPQPTRPVAAAMRTPAPVAASKPTAPKPAAAPPAAKRPQSASASPPRATPTKPTAIDGYSEADRLALASVGRWPPTPPERRGAFWSREDDWPAEWTLTGGDLGRFRGEINLTRAVFAAQLGVPSAVVKDAEMKPREQVGPALQIGVRRAMDQAIQARRARREERAAAQARVVVAQATSEVPRAFTGADLAGLRAERKLSQREMADLLGVEQSTISKGEGKAGAALGPALQEALGRLAVGGARRMPE